MHRDAALQALVNRMARKLQVAALPSMAMQGGAVGALDEREVEEEEGPLAHTPGGSRDQGGTSHEAGGHSVAGTVPSRVLASVVEEEDAPEVSTALGGLQATRCGVQRLR